MASSTPSRSVLFLAAIGLLAIGGAVAFDFSKKRSDPLPAEPSTAQTAGTPVVPAAPTSAATSTIASAPTPDIVSTPPQAPAATTAPAFDIVRVAPEGGAVIAGRAAPGSEVTVAENGTAVGKTRADSHGTWIVTPDKLPPGAGQLTLSAHDATGTHAGDAPVVVVVPNPAMPAPATQSAAPALALLTPPAAPSKLLQGPPATPGSGGKLGLDTVDYDQHGKIEFSGSAPPDAPVRAYVDNDPVGDATAGADGRWSLSPPAPVQPGLHTLRLDQLTASGQVSSRVEVPFERDIVPAAMVADGRVVVQPGNNLWRIARSTYGQGMRYTVIFAANRDQIRSARLIYPGQIFAVPDLTKLPAPR